MRRYETSAQVSQIAERSPEEEYEGVEVMELCPCDGNNRPAPNKNNRIQRNFNQAGCGNFNREGRKGNYDQRPNFENSNRGTGRGANRNYCSQYQDGPKSTKRDEQFQAYGIEGKAVLEALKKLTAYTILQDNGPETDYLR